MDFIANADTISNELSLLITSNDLLFAEKLASFVEELGYRVSAKVTDSLDTLKSIYSDAPDLVLMDIDISEKLSGFQLAKKIKSLAIPVLFVINQENKKDNKLKRRLFSINYIVKPINKFSLRAAIE